MLGSEDGPDAAVDNPGFLDEPDNDEAGSVDGETRGAPVDGAGAGASDGNPNISSGKSTSSMANMLHGAAL
ncbi:hypothetical protein GOP47_0012537 [Adiantum capillus-veneris]|uniref:Uncharacterized protein n=1 Tax=Adiantum capillus-veneris TaxID=13818 RepID=A0A9D4ZGX5_ADICA|nr:hypothetical protein GOP47_0012537 [Adiantum capillus-veneris]